LFLLAAIANRGTAATVTLNPVADAYIRQFDPDRTLVITVRTVVGFGSIGEPAQFEVRRALLQFDLSQIPAGAVVSSATLKITVVMVPMTRTIRLLTSGVFCSFGRRVG